MQSNKHAYVQRNLAGFVERCLMRYLLIKCGHKDVATRELAGLKETFARISGTQILTMTNTHAHHALAHAYGHIRGHAQPADCVRCHVRLQKVLRKVPPVVCSNADVAKSLQVGVD